MRGVEEPVKHNMQIQQQGLGHLCLVFEWMNEVFGPAVKKYLLEKNLPLKGLLVMGNAPAHPSGFEDDLPEEFESFRSNSFP